MNRFLLVWLFPLILPLSSCGDGGGDGGGFGGVAGVEGTLGGAGTTSILYVANSGSSDVSGYTINPTSGVLNAIPGSPFGHVSSPSAVAVSSNGFFAFVANNRTNTVTAFRVSTSGALLFVLPTETHLNPVTVGTAPGALAISSDTKYLYVANSGADTISAFNIGSGGVLSLIPKTAEHPNPVAVEGADPNSMAISPNGKFLYVANGGSNDVTAFSIGATGLLTRLPPSTTHPNPISTKGTIPKGITISPNGSFLYVSNSSSNNVTAFQTEDDGFLTMVPATGDASNPISVGGTTPNALTIAQNGRFLYTANGGGTVTAFTIQGDGLLVRVPSTGSNGNPIAAGTEPVAMAISSDEQFLYVVNRGGRVSAYTVVEGTGALVPLTVLLGNPFPTGTTPSAIATPGRP